MDELIPLELAPPLKLNGTESPATLSPYDLVGPKRVLTPTSAPRYVPRYVPGPLAEGMARVVLDEDYYTGPGWSDYDPRQGSQRPSAVFDVPKEQRDRWEAACEAYTVAQQEMGGLMESRWV